MPGFPVHADTALRVTPGVGPRRRAGAVLEFVRLTTVPREVLAAHMSDPRVAEHMPLLTGPWDSAVADRFVASKEQFWVRNGLGHWAIMADGGYVGWGGFQRQDDAWDFGLVLRPDAFGLGAAITRRALAFARADRRIDAVTFLVPPSRRHLGAFARLGARSEGIVMHGGEVFRKYRLDTA